MREEGELLSVRHLESQVVWFAASKLRCGLPGVSAQRKPFILNCTLKDLCAAQTAYSLDLFVSEPSVAAKIYPQGRQKGHVRLWCAHRVSELPTRAHHDLSHHGRERPEPYNRC